MSREYLTIGSTPPAEDCAQVGSDDYHERMRKETKAYIGQLRRELGEEPPGAQLAVKGFPHDFGMYHEVVCYYNPDDEEATDYAYRCESDGPEYWDDAARAELVNERTHIPSFTLGAVLEHKAKRNRKQKLA